MAAFVATSLAKELKHIAPKVSLSLTPTPGTSGQELRFGSLDLIICPDRKANWQACGIDQDDDEFGHDYMMTNEFVGIPDALRGASPVRGGEAGK
ncbi:MAG: hypothetical protein DI523_10690 [Paraburkholderia fungorum]|nr:MAG: hypothetical protein DI523_10690 [Paraburkholderia fungorum]